MNEQQERQKRVEREQNEKHPKSMFDVHSQCYSHFSLHFALAKNFGAFARFGRNLRDDDERITGSFESTRHVGEFDGVNGQFNLHGGVSDQVSGVVLLFEDCFRVEFVDL